MEYRSSNEAALCREMLPGLEVVTLSRQGLAEVFLTCRPRPGEETEPLFERFSRVLQEREARILKQTVFGACSAHAAAQQALTRAWGVVDWPITWIEGLPCTDSEVAGIQAHAVVGAPVETLYQGGRAVGRVFSDQLARYCILGGILPFTLTSDRPTQARQVFEGLEAALKSAGMECTDVVRTWLFLDRILDWYGEFNPVRTRFFAERQLFDALVPASTGIGGANADGAALVAEAFAVQPFDHRVHAQEVVSPLQCPARAYGSSFSRAVEVASPGVRRLLISGTASIEPGGRSAHEGDIDAQVDLTMRVVEAILVSRGMGFGDVTRAIAYVKHAADAPALARYCGARGIPAFPLILAQDDVCRDELLFEIEVDAIVAGDATVTGSPAPG